MHLRKHSIGVTIIRADHFDRFGERLQMLVRTATMNIRLCCDQPFSNVLHCSSLIDNDAREFFTCALHNGRDIKPRRSLC